MRHLDIEHIESLNNIDIQSAAEVLDEFGKNNAVDVLNWSDSFPYRPITLFIIARSYDAIFIKYSVRGSMLRAIYSNDHDPVYQDSCVEFFCKIPENDYYTNFEFNCIGTCQAARRKSRKDNVIPFPMDDMKRIERYPSIGRRAFKEMEGMFEWELTVKIPFDLIGIDPKNLPEKLLGNFYKCADGTDSPHYVSWSPILTEKPDFHRPEFFGELYL